jgi:hypothetical protein
VSDGVSASDLCGVDGGEWIDDFLVKEQGDLAGGA